jgi:hypothetical protein
VAAKPTADDGDRLVDVLQRTGRADDKGPAGRMQREYVA